MRKHGLEACNATVGDTIPTVTVIYRIYNAFSPTVELSPIVGLIPVLANNCFSLSRPRVHPVLTPNISSPGVLHLPPIVQRHVGEMLIPNVSTEWERECPEISCSLKSARKQ